MPPKKCLAESMPPKKRQLSQSQKRRAQRQAARTLVIVPGLSSGGSSADDVVALAAFAAESSDRAQAVSQRHSLCVLTQRMRRLGLLDCWSNCRQSCLTSAPSL